MFNLLNQYPTDVCPICNLKLKKYNNTVMCTNANSAYTHYKIFYNKYENRITEITVIINKTCFLLRHWSKYETSIYTYNNDWSCIKMFDKIFSLEELKRIEKSLFMV